MIISSYFIKTAAFIELSKKYKDKKFDVSKNNIFGKQQGNQNFGIEPAIQYKKHNLVLPVI